MRMRFGRKLAIPGLEGVIAPKTKYGSKRITVDGRSFHSKAEAKRYQILKMLEGQGEISGLECQPRYTLHAYGGDKVGQVVMDFRYVKRGEGVIVEDKKGYDNPLSQWKRKHFEAEYKIKVLIT